MNPAVFIHGMWGIGDCIHQRAIMRELIATRPTILETYYVAMYHDLIEQGLRLVLRENPKPRIRERTSRKDFQLGGNFKVQPGTSPNKLKLTYNAHTIKQHGSILAAQYASVGLKMPERPNFSLPIPAAWVDSGRVKVLDKAAQQAFKKPWLIYRPMVLNDVWRCDNRLPDPDAFHALFKSIRDRFFVISVADLTQKEWIVGDEQDCDMRFNRGELYFEELCGLVKASAFVFSQPGFGPVLAQALGVPSITVYGGNETAKTTNIVGKHLAPSLFIEPDNPCGCHSGKTPHNCDKHITLPYALDRLSAFINSWGEECAA